MTWDQHDQIRKWIDEFSKKKMSQQEMQKAIIMILQIIWEDRYE